MNNDLISREALKFELRQQLAFQKEKAKLTTINNDKMAHSLVATGIQLAIDIIDNAPTVVNFNTDELYRLRSDLKTGLVVGSTLRYQYQIDRYIKTLDEIISVNMRKGCDD